jgi:cation diffusion facilitator CzcD-associated flavoprotein CzcO
MHDVLAPADVAVDVLVVGTGFGGLTAAIKLCEAGFGDLLIIEKAADVGGTWRDNTYPGCACDVPSHLYSLSFAPKADWSRMYPQQPELRDYLRGVADRYGLREFIRFKTEMISAAWDEARSRWLVQTSSGAIAARVLISAMGGLHIPAWPKLPGLERFAGIVFHSARWDHSYDLTGKRVAVVGTGASAVQFIPRIAPAVARLDVYQRTASWVIPKPDRAISAARQALFRFAPYRLAFRRYLFWWHELRVLPFLGNRRAQAMGQKLAAGHLARQVTDTNLRRKLTPNYKIGCKRLMLSNDYYPALQRENVAIITDGIAEIWPYSIVDTAGVERDVDAIICGTGFEVTSAYKHLNINGIGGQSLGALWDRTGMRAHNGIAVAGFPNYFMLMGPHTFLGHNSVVYMIEAQVNYIVDALKKLRDIGARAIDADPAAQNRFVDGINRRMAGTVWQDGGCQSWYQDEHGQVSAIWPGSAASYRRAVKRANLQDYVVLATEAQPTA